jgi:hypothetical protein
MLAPQPHNLGELVAHVAVRRYLSRRDSRVADLMTYAEALMCSDRSEPWAMCCQQPEGNAVTRPTRADAGGRARGFTEGPPAATSR